MNNPVTSSRWFRAWRRERPVQADPADMGTVFGLEVFFAEPALRPAPAKAKPGWMHRFSARGKRPA